MGFYGYRLGCRPLLVQSSAGFYPLVIKPMFNAYVEGSILKVGPVTLSIGEITNDYDEQKLEYRRVIKLMASPAVGGNGHITVHLFHSQQKVQVQGGSITLGLMAPSWFFRNILEGPFLQNSTTNRVNFDHFNSRVSNISNTMNIS